MWYDIRRMRRTDHILFNIGAVIAVWLGAALCVLVVVDTDGVFSGKPWAVVLIGAIIGCLLVLGALALRIDRPWRAPDCKPQDWPYYVAASLAVAGIFGIMFAPAFFSLGHIAGLLASIAGPFLMMYAFSIATIPLRRRQLRRAAGQCLACGYDLRASAERCPECGTPATSA